MHAIQLFGDVLVILWDDFKIDAEFNGANALFLMCLLSLIGNLFITISSNYPQNFPCDEIITMLCPNHPKKSKNHDMLSKGKSLVGVSLPSNKPYARVTNKKSTSLTSVSVS